MGDARRARLSRAGGGESRAAEEEAGEGSTACWPSRRRATSRARGTTSPWRETCGSRCRWTAEECGDWFVLLDAASLLH